MQADVKNVSKEALTLSEISNSKMFNKGVKDGKD